MEDVGLNMSQELECIYVTASFRKKEYKIPAYKTVNGLYRIPHNALSMLYTKISEEHSDIRLEMDKQVLFISPTYCTAAYHLITKERVYETRVGENKIGIASSQAEKEAPFNIAVNRAQDKVILRDIFGLPTRLFDKNGRPIVYMTDDIFEDAEPEKRSGLNSVEEDEFNKIGELNIRLNTKNGEQGLVKINCMSDSLLKFLAGFEDPEGKFEEQKTHIKDRKPP